MKRGVMAATALAAVLGLMVGSVQANESPAAIYNITGMVQEDIYNNANLSAVMFSDDFNFTTIADMTPTVINSINAQNGPPDNKIVLRLPINGDEYYSVIAEYLYLGTPDDTEATVADTSSLLMTGIVDGVRDLNVAEDHTFHWFIDTAARTIEGGVVMGDFFYKFETMEGNVLITQFPVDDGLCRFRKGSDGPDPRKYNEAREARKAAKRAEKELKRLNRKEARQEKRDQKDGVENRRALAVEEEKEEEEEEEMMENADLHDGHNHHHHHHNAHAAHGHDHGLEHRQLQTVGLLIFLDLEPQSGVYQPWNGGSFIAITACPPSVTVGLLPALISAVREDFAPFNVEVTSNPAVYNASPSKKVRVILARTATGILGGNTCGVAYLNSLNWVGNTVWAGCVCGDAVLAQTISHEVGHILNLRHDGTLTPRSEYLFGLPSTLPSSRRWNAIMGGAAVVGLDQWSRGQYPSASNQEDDVARIRSLVGTRPNTVNAPAGCTNFKLPYRDLTTVPSTTTTTYPQAAITCASGNHQYPVRIRGRYTITVSPVAESNLRFQVQIFTAVRRGGQWVTSGRGTTLGANDAYSSSSVVSAPRTIRTGNYIFRITAIAQATAPNTYAFPVYGSMGFYTVSIRNGF